MCILPLRVAVNVCEFDREERVGVDVLPTTLDRILEQREKILYNCGSRRYVVSSLYHCFYYCYVLKNDCFYGTLGPLVRCGCSFP